MSDHLINSRSGRSIDHTDWGASRDLLCDEVAEYGR